MLCKNCEREIPKNHTVCAYCGTAAVDILKNKQAKKTAKKQNKTNKHTVNKNKKEKPDVLNKEISVNDKQNKTEDSSAPSPGTLTIINETAENVPDGTEIVGSDDELPKPDNTHTLPESSGIMYEIAEELYRREKTASEIEALCQPPFKKVFDQKRIDELNRQASERARILVSSDSEDIASTEKTEKSLNQNPITTGSAFLIQLLLFIPIINIAAAIFFSFGKNVNINIRSYTRAFIIWCVIFMALALVYFAFFYFSENFGRNGIPL